MKIRHARPEDEKAFKAMHAKMGMDYQLPELEKMASALVFEDDGGSVRMAILLRPTVEAYMLVDRAEKLDPREQWARFLCLHKAALKDADSKGIEDVYAFLPPTLEGSFGRKLKKLGWFRPWTAWNRIIRRKLPGPASQPKSD